MEIAFALGIGGWIIVIVAALVFGAIAQFVGTARSDFEWIGDAIAFGIGAVFASEFIVGWRTFEPVVDGLALVPALIGGLVLGTAVAVATRYLAGGTHASGTTPA